MKKLNLKLKDKEVKKRFQEVDFDGNKVLDFQEFTEFLNRLRVREEIDEIFSKLSGERSSLSPKELAKFFDVVQKVIFFQKIFFFRLNLFLFFQKKRKKFQKKMLLKSLVKFKQN